MEKNEYLQLGLATMGIDDALKIIGAQTGEVKEAVRCLLGMPDYLPQRTCQKIREVLNAGPHGGN